MADLLHGKIFRVWFLCHPISIGFKWKMEGLSLYKVRNTKIPSYYGWISNTGIYNRLMVEKMARKNRWRKPAKSEIKENNGRLDGV